ncbi:MAG: hypothetical protein WBD82_08685 [Acidimicrobiales bacterium]
MALNDEEYLDYMNESLRTFARTMIVAGYVLATAGMVAEFSKQISMGYLLLSSKADVDLFAQVFASIADIAAWWFLTQLTLDTARQLTLIRRAFLALALQAAFASVTFFLFFDSFVHLSWDNAEIWGYGFGTIITAIGFFLMMLSYRSSAPRDDNDWPLTEEGPLEEALGD